MRWLRRRCLGIRSTENIRTPSKNRVFGGVDGEAVVLAGIHEVHLAQRLDRVRLEAFAAGVLTQSAAELVTLPTAPGYDVPLSSFARM